MSHRSTGKRHNITEQGEMAEEFKQLHKAAHLTLIEEKIQPVAEDEDTN